MTPKSWPKKWPYSKESVSVDLNLSFLRHCLHTGNPEDLHKTSWVIENRSVHPYLQIKKIVSPHPLGNQRTSKGHINRGIFALEKIPTGTEIGEYVGEISIISPEEAAQAMTSFSEYMWMVSVNHLILKIDAQNIANEIALVNDYRGLGSKPNVQMKPMIHQGFFYFGYVACCDIRKDEEVLVDYGETFENALKKTKAHQNKMNLPSSSVG